MATIQFFAHGYATNHHSVTMDTDDIVAIVTNLDLEGVKGEYPHEIHVRGAHLGGVCNVFVTDKVKCAIEKAKWPSGEITEIMAAED